MHRHVLFNGFVRIHSATNFRQTRLSSFLLKITAFSYKSPIKKKLFLFLRKVKTVGFRCKSIHTWVNSFGSKIARVHCNWNDQIAQFLFLKSQAQKSYKHSKKALPRQEKTKQS